MSAIEKLLSASTTSPEIRLSKIEQFSTMFVAGSTAPSFTNKRYCTLGSNSDQKFSGMLRSYTSRVFPVSAGCLLGSLLNNLLRHCLVIVASYWLVSSRIAASCCFLFCSWTVQSADMLNLCIKLLDCC